ncbi:MAG TPA: hypothetical protein VIC82_04155 [Candidatus Nanopelagicales bacterium]|jgi:hypothetical protein
MAAFGRTRMPDDVRAVAGGERVLSYAYDADGAVVLATDVALHLPQTYGVARLPWDLVVRAGWTTPVLDLTVQLVAGGPAKALAVELPEPGSLPMVVREQVTGSIVVEDHVVLQAGAGARLVARRTESGEVRWSVVFDKGLDPRDPDLRAAADTALAQLRAQLGV